MADFRILVTGSRVWGRPALVREALFAVAAPAIARGDRVVVVHGDARGVDSMAGGWAQRTGGPVVEEPHPVNWGEGKAAGYRRNKEMVALGADVCLAFIAPCERFSCPRPRPHGTHGASHCAGQAERAGIPTQYFRPVEV